MLSLKQLVISAAFAGNVVWAFPTQRLSSRAVASTFELKPVNSTTFNPHYKYTREGATELPTTTGRLAATNSDSGWSFARFYPLGGASLGGAAPQGYIWAAENSTDWSLTCFKWTHSGVIKKADFLPCTPDNATSVGTPIAMYCNPQSGTSYSQWCTMFNGDASTASCVSADGEYRVASDGQNGTKACDVQKILPEQVWHISVTSTD